MALNRQSWRQSAVCGRTSLFHVVASLFLVLIVDAATDATTTDWITATIDGQTVSWPNNYSPTSVAYTPSLLASSFFDPAATSSSSISSSSQQSGPSSTSQASSQISTTSVTNAIASSTSVQQSSSVAATTSAPSSTTSQTSAGGSGEQSNLGAQSQGKTHHSGHSTAIIVGVVVGVVGLALLCIVLCWCRRRWRKRRASPNAPGRAGDSEKAHSPIYNRESEVPILANGSDNAYSDKESSEGTYVSPTHGSGFKRKPVAGAELSGLQSKHRSSVPQQGYHWSDIRSANNEPAIGEGSSVPTILVTGDNNEDHLYQHYQDEAGKPPAATSVSSYEGTRESSIRDLPEDLTPTMSRPHPLRSNPVPLERPENERLHSYQTITDDNPFGDQAIGGRSMLNRAVEPYHGGHNMSTAINAERSGDIEGSLRENLGKTQHNWLGELRLPSPLRLPESLRADSPSEAPSGVPVDLETTGLTSAMATTPAPGARPRLSDLPSDKAVHGLNSSHPLYKKATRGPRTYLAYSQLNETTGLLEERPRFVPGVHQISREEQYRQNRAARQSDPAASDVAADTAPEHPAPSSPTAPPRTWRRSQPTHYLTRQEALTFDFGGQNQGSAGEKRRSLPVQNLDQDGEFGYLHGERVRMYEGA